MFEDRKWYEQNNVLPILILTVCAVLVRLLPSLTGGFILDDVAIAGFWVLVVLDAMYVFATVVAIVGKKRAENNDDSAVGGTGLVASAIAKVSMNEYVTVDQSKVKGGAKGRIMYCIAGEDVYWSGGPDKVGTIVSFGIALVLLSVFLIWSLISKTGEGAAVMNSIGYFAFFSIFVFSAISIKQLFVGEYYALTDKGVWWTVQKRTMFCPYKNIDIVEPYVEDMGVDGVGSIRFGNKEFLDKLRSQNIPVGDGLSVFAIAEFKNIKDCQKVYEIAMKHCNV